MFVPYKDDKCTHTETAEPSTRAEVRFVPSEQFVEEQAAVIDALIGFRLNFPIVARRFSAFPRAAPRIISLSKRHVYRAIIKLYITFVFFFLFFIFWFIRFYNSFPLALT
jgi:hypothetical protein